MVSEKTRTFVFCEISILWSSLRIKFTNLRFEDFRFFRIFVNILRTKKSSAENFFVSPKIFLFGNFYGDFEFFFKKFFSAENLFVRYFTFLFVQTFFFFRKKTENGSNCLWTSPNLRKKSQMLWPLVESTEVFLLTITLVSQVVGKWKKAFHTLVPDSSWLCCRNLWMRRKILKWRKPILVY